MIRSSAVAEKLRDILFRTIRVHIQQQVSSISLQIGYMHCLYTLHIKFYVRFL